MDLEGYGGVKMHMSLRGRRSDRPKYSRRDRAGRAANALGSGERESLVGRKNQGRCRICLA